VTAVSLLDSDWLPEDVRIFGVESSEEDNGKSKLNVSFFVVRDEQIVRLV
jgi:hypothetical protein